MSALPHNRDPHLNRAKRNIKIGKHLSRLNLGAILAAAAILLLLVCIWKWNKEKSLTDSLSVDLPDTLSLTTVTTATGLPEQIISYPGFTVSFNRTDHIPNWVAWELTADETDGHRSRESAFWTDTSVEGCPETYDYNFSGYDRGHMAPAGDMKWSAEAMHASFSLANICPQAHSLNSGAWKRLEEKCRAWARRDTTLVIVCGPVPDDTASERIGSDGDRLIKVPRRFFKVILAPKAIPMRGIGFIMPNSQVKGGMQAAAVTIDSVESLTGHDFFPALPDNVETLVERQCDFHIWSSKK